MRSKVVIQSCPESSEPCQAERRGSELLLMLSSALFALSTSILIAFFFFGSATMHIFIEFLFLNKRHCLIHTSCGVCRSAVCAFWVFGIPEHTLQTRNFCNPETEIKIYTTKLRGWQNLGVIFAV